MAGGTSFATPIMAGIQALVNQVWGGGQGNPNPVYYALAGDQYGQAWSNSCTSSNGSSISGSCIFQDVTTSDIDVPCAASTQDCYHETSGAIGALAPPAPLALDH